LRFLCAVDEHKTEQKRRCKSVDLNGFKQSSHFKILAIVIASILHFLEQYLEIFLELKNVI